MPAAQILTMTRRAAGARLLAALALINTQGQRGGAREHERPYFMPPVERDRLHDLILKQAWAKTDHERLKKAASTGDGFAAAFLYALDGSPRTGVVTVPDRDESGTAGEEDADRHGRA
jgi:hypothetical protein